MTGIPDRQTLAWFTPEFCAEHGMPAPLSDTGEVPVPKTMDELRTMAGRYADTAVVAAEFAGLIRFHYFPRDGYRWTQDELFTRTALNYAENAELRRRGHPTILDWDMENHPERDAMLARSETAKREWEDAGRPMPPECFAVAFNSLAYALKPPAPRLPERPL